MKYLLDANAIIWYFEDSKNLPQRVAKIIDDPLNTIVISSLSLWEIVIKMMLGKLNFKMSFDELLTAINEYDFEIIQIENDYLKELFNVQRIHKDPFDRLLIATAVADNLTLITSDDDIQKYNVKWIW